MKDLKSKSKKIEIAETTIDGTDDILMAFRKFNFIISPMQIAKLTNQETSTYQISCLPKFSYGQQCRLAVRALDELGFLPSQIHLETKAGTTDKRLKIYAVNSVAKVYYLIDLGLLQITLAS